MDDQRSEQTMSLQDHDFEIESDPEATNERVRKEHNVKCLISYRNFWKQCWDAFVMLLLLFVTITVPLRLAFTDEDSYGWFITNGVVDLLFFLDIILTFLTSFLDE